ncbi:Protein SYS1-like protein [Diplonema papillatum]|nr:Protein SYS1-like protein [Diplonema papillatum]
MNDKDSRKALNSQYLSLGRIIVDPQLIASQIVLLQGSFYLILSLFFFVTEGMLHHRTRFELIFNARILSFHTVDGVVGVMTNLVASLVGSWTLLVVVGRSKQCLDFAATLFFFHFILCWKFYGFPSYLWWCLTLIDVSSMTIVSEYLCMRQELREIPIQNPDERHGQQAKIVQQKERELASRAAASLEDAHDLL